MNILYFTKLKDIAFSKLMSVYSQSNYDNSRLFYPSMDQETALRETEQDFYAFLRMFFCQEAAVYAVAEENGQYLSALRMEKYQDGLLIQALETKPDQRGRGLATALLLDTAQYARNLGFRSLYSHIDKSNRASIAAHLHADYRILCYHAVYVDGSVSQAAYTLHKTL